MMHNCVINEYNDTLRAILINNMKVFELLVSLFMVAFLLGCSGPVETKTEDLLTSDEVDALIEDPEFMTDYREAMEEAMEEEKMNEDNKLVEELIDLEDDKKVGNKSKGSCNSIGESSTCIEYYGAFWTEQIIRQGCSESNGIFSTKPCPSGMSGGCNTGVGTMADMVVWMYLSGGGGMTAESMKHASMACSSTLASRWVVTN